ncbi:MAG: hypothetical protein K1X66_00315 [Verrucomicrobiae bacterium]|nr:hypothetical protein [Verrucomicrobiae bacterium]
MGKSKILLKGARYIAQIRKVHSMMAIEQEVAKAIAERDTARLALKAARDILKMAEKRADQLHGAEKIVANREVATAKKSVDNARRIYNSKVGRYHYLKKLHDKASADIAIIKEEVVGDLAVAPDQLRSVLVEEASIAIERSEKGISSWIGGPLVLQEKVKLGESVDFWDGIEALNSPSIPQIMETLVQGEPVGVVDVGLASLELIENPLSPVMDGAVESCLSALKAANTPPVAVKTAAAMGKAVQEISQEATKPSVWEMAEGKDHSHSSALPGTSIMP